MSGVRSYERTSYQQQQSLSDSLSTKTFLCDKPHKPLEEIQEQRVKVKPLDDAT